jgi:hypothetical protein
MKRSILEKLNLNLVERKGFVLLILLIVSPLIVAQRASDFHYTPVSFDVTSEESDGIYRQEYIWGVPYYQQVISEFTNILKDNIRDKKELQRIEYNRQQAVAKYAIIKNQYAEYTEYPSVITDGWHSAIAADNFNFCKDVKVLVKNNKIQKFVIDNYIPLNFMAIREIKNAKNVVTLKNFGGEEMNIVEVYFLYDIEVPNIVPEPITPGFVCFWSDLQDYDEIILKFDGRRIEDITVRYLKEPDCFSNGMVCRILKPGKYSFFAMGRGLIDWEGTVEIKENMCLKVRLGRYY